MHRWGAVAVAAPVLVVIGSGILLQVKKQVPWVQPPTRGAVAGAPSLSFAEILAAARSTPDAQIAGWEDVARLDVQPGRGLVKVQGKNHWEVQVDTATGEVLQVAYRRSDLIESLHDGSWFSDTAKMWIFLPSGVVLLGLWATGLYLWWLPHGARRRKRRAVTAAPLQKIHPPGAAGLSSAAAASDSRPSSS